LAAGKIAMAVNQSAALAFLTRKHFLQTVIFRQIVQLTQVWIYKILLKKHFHLGIIKS